MHPKKLKCFLGIVQEKNNHLYSMTTIPLDCVNEVLSYLPDGGGATRQFRTEKPYIKNYLDSFCMAYTSSNLEYFNWLYEREDPRGIMERLAHIPIKLASQSKDLGLCRHQCCGITTKGPRCKNKTFGLFCSRHEGSTACYWTTPSSLYPAH